MFLIKTLTGSSLSSFPSRFTPGWPTSRKLSWVLMLLCNSTTYVCISLCPCFFSILDCRLWKGSFPMPFPQDPSQYLTLSIYSVDICWENHLTKAPLISWAKALGLPPCLLTAVQALAMVLNLKELRRKGKKVIKISWVCGKQFPFIQKAVNNQPLGNRDSGGFSSLPDSSMNILFKTQRISGILFSFSVK